jgi:hypothetical protein
MTEEQITPETQNAQPNPVPKTRPKTKRDIFRFNGERPTAINLEHVTNMSLEGRKITFNFYSTAIFVELADDAAAASVFEVLLANWSADVVE